MWSRRFLWTGLSSGTAVAALTLAGMFLVLFVWFGGKSPDSKIVAFASPGVIIAPACWYVIIFRQRDYSLSKTMMLVGVAFGVVSLIIALIAFGVVLSMISPARWRIESFLTAGDIAFRIAFAGALFLVLPYVIVAPPMALLHRWLLLKIFASTGSMAAP
jgi:hypothetical protein